MAAALQLVMSIASGVLQALLVVMVVLVVRFYYKTTGFWSRRGIVDAVNSPSLALSLTIYFRSEFIGYIVQRVYKHARAKGDPCVGCFAGNNPMLMAVDQDLIRSILATDFSHFTDRRILYDRDRKESAFNAHLISLQGEEWRFLRKKLTPTFTSARMRAMFPLVGACAEDLRALLKAEAASCLPVGMNRLFSRFTIDVIGSCAFGMQANAMKNPQAELLVMGEKIMNQNFTREVLNELPGPIRSVLMAWLTSSELKPFFTRLFKETFEMREHSKERRGDFVDLLLDIKNEDRTGTFEAILPAQALIFFVAGYETSSNALGNVMTELAHNPDVQDKARAEVQRVLAKHGGQIPYEALQDLTYVEQVIDETLRLYPIGFNMHRVVTKEYTLPISTKNGKPAVLPKDMLVLIPVFSIHRDPEFYPDPDKFNPDNFTAEAKRARPSYTFMPFGEGPRICIAVRFAMMQMKAAVAAVLRDFRLEPVPGINDYPPRFQPRRLTLQTCGGNHVYLRPI